MEYPRGLDATRNLRGSCFIKLLTVYYLFLLRARLSQSNDINTRKACLVLGGDLAPLCFPVFPFLKIWEFAGVLAVLKLCARQG